MKLSIVIVNTNEWHVLEPCLRSVFRETTGIDFEVIVVDNASTDGTKEHLQLDFPQVRVISNHENLGFAAANNRGIVCAQGEYILLLNPDTIVLDEALQKSVWFLEQNKQADIVGCKLLFPDRSLQRSVRSFPSIANVFYETTFLYLLFPRSKSIGSFYMSYFDYAKDTRVDWVSGAYIMFSKRVLETIGLLDEQFYMYTEEMDFCYRARKAGFQTWFTPKGEVLHFWGGINSTNRRVMAWTLGSQILFFQKHYHGLQKFVMVGLKALGAMLRVGVYAVGGCLTWNKLLMRKTYYVAFAFYQLFCTKWKYRHDFTGPVLPWPRY